ncbi:unnamed protein product, partial [Ranitomeya imitator]
MILASIDKDMPYTTLFGHINSWLMHRSHSPSNIEIVGYIGGLSTAFQNAVDKPLMPMSLAHLRFCGANIFRSALQFEHIIITVPDGAHNLNSLSGAHLIVTPEDGIYGWRFTRQTIYPFLEDIPDPSVNWIPCSHPERFGPAPVQTRLSCMAKDNSIYVVANMGDKKLCNISDAGCPDDGQYIYNTAVVYDSNGKLVARYHKISKDVKQLKEAT